MLLHPRWRGVGHTSMNAITALSYGGVLVCEDRKAVQYAKKLPGMGPLADAMKTLVLSQDLEQQWRGRNGVPMLVDNAAIIAMAREVDDLQYRLEKHERLSELNKSEIGRLCVELQVVMEDNVQLRARLEASRQDSDRDPVWPTSSEPTSSSEHDAAEDACS